MQPAANIQPRFRYLLIIGGGIVLSLAASSVISKWPVLGVWPDIVTLYALFFTLFSHERGRYVPCMVLGLIRDLFSAGTFGTYAILYGLLHRAVSPYRATVFPDNPLTLMLTASAAVAAVNLGYHGTLVLQGTGIGWAGALDTALLLAVVSGPLMPVLAWLMKLLFKRIGVERLPGGAYNV